VAKVYPGIGEDFQKSALQGGWLALSPNEFNEQTQNWLAKRSALNTRLENGEAEAVAQVKAEFQKYTEENRASMLEWYYLLIELIKENPQMVYEISLQYDGIIRLYDTEEVFNGAVKSHQEERVIKRTLNPQELAEEMPAYAAGVANGFIKGGAIEMYGLTIGIQSFCKSLIRTMQSKGVEFAFDTQIKDIETIDGKLDCLVDGNAKKHKSKHYSFNTGAYHGGIFAKLFPEQTKQDNPAEIAGMEGYWITLEQKNNDGVYDIIDAMQGKPNKVHGKQSIASCLAKVSPQMCLEMALKLEELGINFEEFTSISPTVDFSIMPIYSGTEAKIGVGSGYVFTGIGTRKEGGEIQFADSTKAQEFTQVMMQLWLAALYGEELLNECKMNVIKKPCTRSWTPQDMDKFLSLVTTDGGKAFFAGGGGTGTATKSPVEADRVVAEISGEETHAKRLGAEFATQQVLHGLTYELHRANIIASINTGAPKELLALC